MLLLADEAKEMKMVSKGAGLRAQHADLDRLVVLCQSELSAVQVWLFGSRAHGDHHANSDFDILAILPDDAPDAAEDPITVFLLRRRSGLHADLLVARLTDFEGARDTVTTISFIVHREGVRLDV
ncbi:nucleotidyltransferase domain-containing protein [Sulfitobacter pseudonitzschiae]|uniref:Nucleotidyltransferase domain-containing protein n=1 Tax=Pseudosulfitobacter pseudonitzschiae TaxID=1402135 RepID=A0A9Q2NYH9_9RHOB|nr:nucleotidyltransferase domain-containing protein [Pseudosulfitobacter pseudonitzschiae]MBM2299817.1 nucleotidyltransferase domain-containing protein [Pseudosulfitobacter pseudonitzschiae]MBM2304738.1 nucleotidyltransferase domain-containing protein [Pseudosulfitobacter pseudonitzschiae]MBM2314512.1 nucleotidyltransferase domain-containing protein [Pseudosulfitobacter pseudonitzschiae]MBM2319422.1 nucleotidyltransferase domain-containing protein [Pseudosulfitobacter pseudonitzschiae]